jgi:hypothetical protein
MEILNCGSTQLNYVSHFGEVMVFEGSFPKDSAKFPRLFSTKIIENVVRVTSYDFTGVHSGCFYNDILLLH